MKDNIYPLKMAAPGEEIKIVEIRGGRAMRSRVTSMGLNEGMRIKLHCAQNNGPCMIMAGDTRLAIGEGMAEKIYVKKARKLDKTKMKKIKIALAGNPNSGKTSVFNHITGTRQHVGNYPGVTVEKKEGNLIYKDYDIDVIDLPGTYSLSAYSLDEIVARDFIVDEKPDVIINVVDASNLERNLYLSTQIIELGIPMVMAFNMYDVVQKQGWVLDTKMLSVFFGSPIVYTVGSKGEGIDELLHKTIEIVEDKIDFPKPEIKYSKELSGEIEKLTSVISKDEILSGKFPIRWLSIKILEDDKEVLKQIDKSPLAKEIKEQAEESKRLIESVYKDTAESIIADSRYGYISGACSEAVQKSYEIRHTTSDKIDKILINRILGLPIFLAMMWAVFKFTFSFSEPLMGWVEKIQEVLGNLIGGLLPDGSAIQGLVVDGVIGGVGSVLVFVPIIFLLFFAISLLEDSGYMARAAFIMDRIMHKIGLHGRSFIPLLLGFGCTMPAVMATRTIEDKKDRFVTILVCTFMSCGARLPVYVLLIGAFFPEKIAGNVLFSIYILGIVLAILVAKIFRKYLFPGEAAPFVMELPPYRIPTLKGMILHTWERGKLYLQKAGTIIFAGCVIVWFLSNFPWNPQYSKDYDHLIEQAAESKEQVIELENEMAEEKMAKSYAGRIGKVMAPVFKPLGFGDYKIAVGLIGGFIAKEIVVGTLGTLYSVGESDEESIPLREKLRNDTYPDGRKVFTPLVAYALMVFVLIYVPCVAVMAVIKRETNSWGWMFFTAGYTTLLAWIMAFIVYNGGRLLGLG